MRTGDISAGIHEVVATDIFYRALQCCRFVCPFVTLLHGFEMVYHTIKRFSLPTSHIVFLVLCHEMLSNNSGGIQAFIRDVK